MWGAFVQFIAEGGQPLQIAAYFQMAEAANGATAGGASSVAGASSPSGSQDEEPTLGPSSLTFQNPTTGTTYIVLQHRNLLLGSKNFLGWETIILIKPNAFTTIIKKFVEGYKKSLPTQQQVEDFLKHQQTPEGQIEQLAEEQQRAREMMSAGEPMNPPTPGPGANPSPLLGH